MAATNENERKITHTLTDREGQRERRVENAQIVYELKFLVTFIRFVCTISEKSIHQYKAFTEY